MNKLHDLVNHPQNHFRYAANSDCDKIKRLVFGILAAYGLEPDPASTDADLNDLEESYFKRGGLFYVLEIDGVIYGSAGLYKINEETCELRKMYLHPDYRGRGLGKEMLELLVSEARRLGYSRAVLETASVLKEAIELYKSRGFIKYESVHLSSRCDQAFLLRLK